MKQPLTLKALDMLWKTVYLEKFRLEAVENWEGVVKTVHFFTGKDGLILLDFSLTVKAAPHECVNRSYR